MHPHEAAARLLWEHWQNGRVLDALPHELRPADPDEAFAIAGKLPVVSGRAVLGWKLAATNPSGQAHIGVDGPIPGRLLSGQVLESGANVDLTGTRMRVAEAEFGFRLADDIPPRQTAYRPEELVERVASLHPCIEFPDSRFENFAQAGAPQLIADCACAHLFVAGAAASVNWRPLDLVTHRVSLSINDQVVRQGTGADVLGSPWLALTWLANEHRATGGLLAGQMVTTGVCASPAPVSPGDHVLADFGPLGQVRATIS